MKTSSGSASRSAARGGEGWQHLGGSAVSLPDVFGLSTTGLTNAGRRLNLLRPAGAGKEGGGEGGGGARGARTDWRRWLRSSPLPGLYGRGVTYGLDPGLADRFAYLRGGEVEQVCVGKFDLQFHLHPKGHLRVWDDAR